MNYLIESNKIYIYRSKIFKNIDYSKIQKYVREKLNMHVEIRDDFILHHLGQEEMHEIARKIAETRVRNVMRKFFVNPSPGEVEYERKILKKPAKITPLYDGMLLQLTFRKIIPKEEYGDIHIIFIDRLIATYDEVNGRYHARVIICGHPSLISPHGVIVALAKPKEYYYQKQLATMMGIPIELIDEKFRNRTIGYDDDRFTQFMVIYVMQVLFYAFTGDAFCEDEKCILFNAHWQEELIRLQLHGKLCERHQKIMEEIVRKRKISPQ